VEAGLVYQMEVAIESGGSLLIEGSAIANEGDWDDGLPLRLENYDGFGGIYQPGLNFNMYTEENPEKLQRFLDILDETEYILISSNRQWGSLPRLPERFPLSTVYYRTLLGCPEDKTIFWCYAVAKPGMFQGSLGFELVHIQQSNPALGPLEINDQFAEEAFHVYEHPKVLIFRKTEAYNAQAAAAILGRADLTKVVRVTPKKAGPFPANLLLPADRQAEQQAGGTWSDFFNPQALHNRYQILGVVVWYLAILVIGLLAYPALRLAMPGLADRGYPLSRITGLLVLAYLVWLAGSLRLPFTRLTIGLALLLMAVAAGWLAYLQRDGLRKDWTENKRYFLMVEGLILAFFLLFLLVRFGNPDLWHQWKGGEKPMDFAYFNAVLKSTSFPPYDPWYAGGYLNYYYYGFVIVGVPVKLLGIVPSFAYNLILATMFSLTSVGAFSIAWNLVRKRRFLAGMASVLGMSVLGNLGTLRMIVRGYQGLVDAKFLSDGPGFFERLLPTFQGMGRVVSGQPLSYGIGDWYWNPSRIMPPGDNAITEMPAFTFLYGDPHAHLFAMPIALLCLGGALALVLGKGRWRSAGQVLLNLSLLALAIGATWPTNTWDFPTYLALGLIAVIYTFWRYLPVDAGTFSRSRLLQPLANLHPTLKRLSLVAGSAIVLLLLANVLYLPYSQWYGQGYSSIEAWLYQVTPLNAYFTHWGLFLFILVIWMGWESLDWMAKTPLSSVRKLDGFWEVIWILLALLLAVIAILAIKLPMAEPFVIGKLALGRGVAVAVIALPLAAWSGVLLLRPGQPDAKRFILFLTGTALVITLVVELVVLRGDIGRQNTVFKLYLQAWTLFAICAAAALAWVWGALPGWTAAWKIAFQSGLILLVGAAALFPLLGGTAKIRDRMAPQAPHTLDGMAYMQYARYTEAGIDMDLSQDYRLIRWMQDNIPGSPVIVEANSGNLYRWYTRITAYTGLPGVVGWEWHQQQQRALVPPDWVNSRLREINEFYQTDRIELAVSFLDKYNVQYIVFGQLERATYPGPGLEKFAAFDGALWQEVYRDQETILYQVINP
jgi:YYY domain-containing protein